MVIEPNFHFQFVLILIDITNNTKSSGYKPINKFNILTLIKTDQI